MTRRRLIGLLGIAAASGLAWMAGTTVPRVRELNRQLVCASNVKGVATALKMYSNDYPGRGASMLQWLVDSGNIPETALTCPTSGLSNYVFLSAPSEGPLDDRTVMAYEPKSNHGNGGNVVFADGHASFHRGEIYDRMTARPTSWWEDGREDP